MKQCVVMKMNVFWILTVALSVTTGAALKGHSLGANDVQLYPANGQHNVNPDAQLKLTFSSIPEIGASGKINVYDAENKKLIDTLDLSIPFSPSPYGNGSTKANYTDTTKYQTNIIGGLDFYFNPILVRNNTATIYLHNNKLTYNRTYLVEIEPSVLKLSKGGSSFRGFTTSNPWTFTTKPHGPKPGTTSVTVAADGSGDFNTVQGALDWAPANPPKRTRITIKSGRYEELVFFQYKSNLLIRGSTDPQTNTVLLTYPNNSAFNPPNRQGPSRRPAFSYRGTADIQLSTFTITNQLRGQAEALLTDGTRVILDRMTLHGAGDALTTYGTLYAIDTFLSGTGDTILGYASAFWARCRIESFGAVTWTRTAQGVKGNVFLNSTIVGLDGDSTFARLPDNEGGVMDNWPFAEMVLLGTRTAGIVREGWGPVQGAPFDSSRVRFWEFDTRDLEGGEVDLSGRLGVSRVLRLPADKGLIEEYKDPVNVLGGWRPVVIDD